LFKCDGAHIKPTRCVILQADALSLFVLLLALLSLLPSCILCKQSGADAAGAGGSSPGRGSGGGGGAAQTFGGVGSSLANFGKQLISGTKEVIDTVRVGVCVGEGRGW